MYRRSIIILCLIFCFYLQDSVYGGPVRTWTSKNGKFTIKAELLSFAQGVVHLRPADGKTIKVPLAKLSKDDQNYVTKNTNRDAQLPGSKLSATGTDSVIVKEWESLEYGDICYGPGSYYLHDRTITEMHKDITTLAAAHRYVTRENEKDPQNGVIMWQLTNPQGKPPAPQYLVFHRRKFLEQNLDANTGQPISSFAKSVSAFGKGQKRGSPMFFREAPSGTVETARKVIGVADFTKVKVQRRTELQKPRNHSGFFAFAVSSKGKLVAGGTGAGKMTFNGKTSVFGGEVLLWNAESGQLKRTLGQHGASVNWLRFSDDERILTSCSGENELVQIWELSAGKRLSTFQLTGPFNSFHPPVLSPDGAWLAAVAEEKRKIGDREITVAGVLSVWDTRNGKLKWSVPHSHAKCLAAAEDGKTVAAFVEEIRWSPAKNGKLVGKYGKRAVTVWDAANGHLRWQTDSVRFSPAQLRFDSERERLLGLNSSTLMSWDLESGSRLEKTTLGTGQARSRPSPHQFRLSADGRSAGIVAFMGNHVELWDLANVTQLAGLEFKFPNTLRNAAFSPDLQSVVCVQNHDPVILHFSW